MNVTKDEIIKIIDDVGVSVDSSKIKQGLSFKEAGVDSLEMMNVFLGIEEAYDIKISDDDVNKLNSLSDIVSYIENI